MNKIYILNIRQEIFLSKIYSESACGFIVTDDDIMRATDRLEEQKSTHLFVF